MKVEPRTLKGFRDFLPREVKKRQYVLEILKKVFESYGFEPLETPALEYDEILTGKYGDEGEKLMYRFEDNGRRKVAMRYDQTVPLARVVAQYQNEVQLPFKRYQIQNVWRAENTQRGRYREFLQVDADIVGTYSSLADAEIIATAKKCLEELGFRNFKILVNDRFIFNNLSLPEFESLTEPELGPFIRSLDKLKKIGEEKVLEELIQSGFEKERAKTILQVVQNQKTPTGLSEVFSAAENLGVKKNDIQFLPTLARGLDYYTGMIFEIEVEGFNAGSVAGGGRYDNLIGIFAGRDIPAVGFSFGFDRLMEAMEALSLFPNKFSVTKVLVTYNKYAPEIGQTLRENDINAEVYPDEKDLEKQLKYADKKNVPYVMFLNGDSFILKDMIKQSQEELPLEEIIKKLK